MQNIYNPIEEKKTFKHINSNAKKNYKGLIFL